MKQLVGHLASAIVAFACGGCAVVYFAGMPFVYEPAKLGGATEVSDLAYVSGPEADEEKHRLDLFVPSTEDWPILVFVHGGGWTSGDKDLRVGGKDVYRNIGRYYAARGIGVAVINYRLLPGVHWWTQAKDVARATVYVQDQAARRGADTTRLFLSGHSAGAQLVTRITLDPEPMRLSGGSASDVCGVIAVSGAGYDMLDQQTYALGAEIEYLERRFDLVDPDNDWARDASVVQFASEDAPPFLILYGEDEHPGLRHQSRLLAESLERVGVDNETVVVPGFRHARMVLAMSRDDQTAAPAIEQFIADTDCSPESDR